MDIEKIIKDAIAKLTGDGNLLKEFAANPVKTLEEKLGVDLPDEQIQQVISGIKDKISLDNLGDLAGKAQDVVEQAGKGGLLDKIKGFFGGK